MSQRKGATTQSHANHQEHEEREGMKIHEASEIAL
jgi:hypothetical protein